MRQNRISYMVTMDRTRLHMPQAKSTVRRKRRGKSVPLLRAAGLSLSLAAGPPTAIEASTADVPMRSLSPSHELLHEEEITDLSLATFHILEKEITPRRGTRLSGGCGACGAGLYAVPTVLGPERPSESYVNRPKRRQFLEEQQAPRNPRTPKNMPVPKQVPKNLYQNANRPAEVEGGRHGEKFNFNSTGSTRLSRSCSTSPAQFNRPNRFDSPTDRGCIRSPSKSKRG